MERRGVVVGALAVASVALAAGAASPSTAPAGGGGVAFGAGSDGGGGMALGGVLWLVVLVALVAGGGWLLVAHLRSAGGGGRRLRRRFVALVLAVAVVVAGVLLVAVRVFEDGEGPGGPDGVGGPLVQGSPESVTPTGGPGPGVVLAVLVVLALLVGGWLAVRRLRGGDGGEREADEAAASDVDEPDDAGTDVFDGTALGSAAGRAAVHLDDAESPPANDVVRAWRELAAVLPVARPETSTPREFASAATAAGVDPDAVAELTSLFEAVRYGDRDPSGERAERAVAALERVEAEYGASDSGEEAEAEVVDARREEVDERGGSR
ncbi:DUF4129 domain-containing protein [Halorubellus salinus]|uniref:DUF4129 domain-containing protein n=1 Tax=Halorubellus salinus TaxID=755309 RepID=UPI001D0988D6|nr:DUF4129 domain-containing protein [Halorubellus salinus]